MIALANARDDQKKYLKTVFMRVSDERYQFGLHQRGVIIEVTLSPCEIWKKHYNVRPEFRPGVVSQAVTPGGGIEEMSLK